MKNLFVLKVLVLIAMLIGVLMTIQKLNSGTVEKAFDAIGIQAGTAQAPGFQPSGHALVAGEVSYNFCPNRIRSIQWEGGPLSGKKIEETRDGLKMRWMAFDPQPRELGYLEVEKWLSAHCKLVVKPAELASGGTQNPSVGAALAVSVPFIHVTYIDGKDLKIEIGPNETFFFKNPTTSRFYSPDFSSAIRDLEKIAQFTTASS